MHMRHSGRGRRRGAQAVRPLLPQAGSAHPVEAAPPGPPPGCLCPAQASAFSSTPRLISPSQGHCAPMRTRALSDAGPAALTAAGCPALRRAGLCRAHLQARPSPVVAPRRRAAFLCPALAGGVAVRHGAPLVTVPWVCPEGGVWPVTRARGGGAEFLFCAECRAALQSRGPRGPCLPAGRPRAAGPGGAVAGSSEAVGGRRELRCFVWPGGARRLCGAGWGHGHTGTPRRQTLVPGLPCCVCANLCPAVAGAGPHSALRACGPGERRGRRARAALCAPGL